MIFHILTLFPGMFAGPFNFSIVKRAQDQNKIDVHLYNLRNWAVDKRGTVDGRVYGGGVGMILMVEPVYKALEDIKRNLKGSVKTILLTPKGAVYGQKKAAEFSKMDHLILVCGHYEGYDERICNFIDEEISLGKFILTGGEIPAIAIVDSVTRLIPGVLLKPEAIITESFSESETSFEPPQYTRPEEFKGLKVPEVLLSGNHGKIEKWRKEKADFAKEESM